MKQYNHGDTIPEFIQKTVFNVKELSARKTGGAIEYDVDITSEEIDALSDYLRENYAVLRVVAGTPGATTMKDDKYFFTLTPCKYHQALAPSLPNEVHLISVGRAGLVPEARLVLKKSYKSGTTPKPATATLSVADVGNNVAFCTVTHPLTGYAAFTSFFKSGTTDFTSISSVLGGKLLASGVTTDGKNVVAVDVASSKITLYLVEPETLNTSTVVLNNSDEDVTYTVSKGGLLASANVINDPKYVIE